MGVVEILTKTKTKTMKKKLKPHSKINISKPICVCKHPLRVAGDVSLEPYCGKCFNDFK